MKKKPELHYEGNAAPGLQRVHVKVLRKAKLNCDGTFYTVTQAQSEWSRANSRNDVFTLALLGDTVSW